MESDNPLSLSLCLMFMQYVGVACEPDRLVWTVEAVPPSESQCGVALCFACSLLCLLPGSSSLSFLEALHVKYTLLLSF